MISGTATMSSISQLFLLVPGASLISKRIARLCSKDMGKYENCHRQKWGRCPQPWQREQPRSFSGLRLSHRSIHGLKGSGNASRNTWNRDGRKALKARRTRRAYGRARSAALGAGGAALPARSRGRNPHRLTPCFRCSAYGGLALAIPSGFANPETLQEHETIKHRCLLGTETVIRKGGNGVFIDT